MSIGKNIKKLRKRYNLTQQELAEIAEVSNKAISTWENELKEPRMGAIQKISSHFGIKISELIESEIVNTETKNTSYEKEILKNLDKLNEKGQLKTLEYTKDLSTNPFYIKEDKEIFINAAHAILGATKKELQHDEDIMNDENF